MYKHAIIIIFFLISSLVIAQPEPERDSYGEATFTDDAIRHKHNGK